MSIAERPKTQLSEGDQRKANIKAWIIKATSDVKMGLPKHMTAERMTRIAISGLSRNPLLLECTPQSIVLALINASETGLEPNGYEAHLVPYKNNKANPPVYEAQFQPDYKGLMQLAYRSGLVLSIDADAVYEKDEFTYERGSEEHLRHIPADMENRGNLKFAWASARLKGGGFKFVVLNRSQIEKHKSASQAARKNYGPWKDHEEAMWIKTAVKVLAKFIPRSAELQAAVQLDDQAEIGAHQVASQVDMSLLNFEDDPPPVASQSEALAQRLRGSSGQPEQLAIDTDREPSANEKQHIQWQDGYDQFNSTADLIEHHNAMVVGHPEHRTALEEMRAGAMARIKSK